MGPRNARREKRPRRRGWQAEEGDGMEDAGRGSVSGELLVRSASRFRRRRSTPTTAEGGGKSSAARTTAAAAVRRRERSREALGDVGGRLGGPIQAGCGSSLLLLLLLLFCVLLLTVRADLSR